jgi:hypothetical protein
LSPLLRTPYSDVITRHYRAMRSYYPLAIGIFKIRNFQTTNLASTIKMAKMKCILRNIKKDLSEPLPSIELSDSEKVKFMFFNYFQQKRRLKVCLHFFGDSKRNFGDLEK